MSDRGRQGIFLLFLSLALSLFLVGHSLVVQVDFEACFGNLAAAVNGDRPYHRFGEMSSGELANAAVRQLSIDQLFVAVFGLFPLSPFLIAWFASRTRPARLFWISVASIALLIIVTWTATRSLADFYDCDRNGISLTILVAPILYAVISLLVALGLVLLRYLIGSSRE